MKILLITLFIILLIFIGPMIVVISGQINFKDDYRTASRESAQLAPDPKITKEAVIQAYGARAFNWRGAFGIHCWIAVKPKNADEYIVYQLIGWNIYHGKSMVDIRNDIPDRSWFNQKPKIILDIRGEEAQKLIPQIQKAAEIYPYTKKYTLWPGPNSNSFIAHIGRNVPDLGLTLPAAALGKDFLGENKFFAKTPSATGYQFSLYGLLGIALAKKEGIEINILGLNYGIRFQPFGIIFPGFY